MGINLYVRTLGLRDIADIKEAPRALTISDYMGLARAEYSLREDGRLTNADACTLINLIRKAHRSYGAEPGAGHPKSPWIEDVGGKVYRKDGQTRDLEPPFRKRMAKYIETTTAEKMQAWQEQIARDNEEFEAQEDSLAPLLAEGDAEEAARVAAAAIPDSPDLDAAVQAIAAAAASAVAENDVPVQDEPAKKRGRPPKAEAVGKEAKAKLAAAANKFGVNGRV